MNPVLALNGGSTSIRFALFERSEPPRRRLAGKVDRIGESGINLTFRESGENTPEQRVGAPAGQTPAPAFLLDWLAQRPEFSAIAAAGHRIVQGGPRDEPARITPELLDELRLNIPDDPDHLPLEIGLIEAFRARYPGIPQVACFDSVFHRSLPRVARLLPLPRLYEAQGVRRYGFHGLSYAWLMEELARLDGPAATGGRVILAHLGGGASLAAVRDGRCIDTSMGFTPASGLMMGTRTGDLDPGVGGFLARTEAMSAEQYQRMVNRESGLLGVSETSADLRELLSREAADPRAADAVELFCYQAKKWIGAYAAALGGLDTLVFTAGIGENCPSIRARICDGLGFLGIELDEAGNHRSAPVISGSAGRTVVRVIPTDEEQMIARSVCRMLGSGAPGGGG